MGCLKSGTERRGNGVGRFDSAALCRVLFEEIGLSPTAEFALAYSGGRDSQVLLHALSAARAQYGFALTALHFDHGLSPQSAIWARQCEAVCRNWDIPFVGHRQALSPPPGESVEAFARRARYRWFARAVESGQTLLTAHHANDQAETVLLNLLRGGGVELLAGIPRRRVLSAAKSTWVVRPLLAFSRAVLAEYARRHALCWIEDPANRSPDFDRNFVRASLIPLLEQRWPGAVASLGRGASRCRQTAAFLDEIAEEILQRCQAAHKRGVFCRAPPLVGGEMQQLGRFRTYTLMRHWIHRHGCRSPSSGQLDTFYRQVFEERRKSASVEWDRSELRYFAGHLYLTTRLDHCAGGDVAWNLRARDLGRNGLRVEVDEVMGGGLNPRRLLGRSVRLSWRAGGERMTLPGRKHSNSLKKLFQQNAVPPWERDELPLVVVDGEVAWAHGVGVGEVACGERDERDGKGIVPRFVVVGD